MGLLVAGGTRSTIMKNHKNKKKIKVNDNRNMYKIINKSFTIKGLCGTLGRADASNARGPPFEPIISIIFECSSGVQT